MDETTLVDTVVDLADADDTLTEEPKYLILAALDGEEALDGELGGRAARQRLNTPGLGAHCATIDSTTICAGPSTSKQCPGFGEFARHST